MAAGRPVLGLVSLILIAGGIVMTFFIVLSGFINNVVPIKNTWFLQAQTTNISGGNSNLKNPARWTYLAICGVTNGYNANCGPTTAALPFAPAHNFGTTSGVPAAFTGNHFYYLSRFAWVFYLISLFFAVVSFFLGFLALCTRLGAYLTGLNAAIALFFQALAASLMTAWTVQARNVFRRNGVNAYLGADAYGFTWATFACYLIATVLFCVGGALGKNEKSGYQKNSYFGRKRSTRSQRSRGSFIDSESQRRVKDEYD